MMETQMDNSKGVFQSCNSDSSLHHAVIGLSYMLPPAESCQFGDPFNSKIMASNANNLLRDIRSHLLSTNCEIISGNDSEVMSRKCSESGGSVAKSTSLYKILSSSKTAASIDSCVPISKLTTQIEVDANLHSSSYKNTAKDIIDSTMNNNPNACSSLKTENVTIIHQKVGNSISQSEITQNAAQVSGQLETCKTEETTVSNYKIEHSLDVTDKAGPNLKTGTCSFPSVLAETPVFVTKSRKRRLKIENNTYDWESLRKEVCCTKLVQERSSTTLDSLDWEAVRLADVSKISETIRERGMNNVLAERIKVIFKTDSKFTNLGDT